LKNSQEAALSSNLLKSAGAVVAGAAVGIVLSVGTDAVMHKTGVFPASGGAMSDWLFVLATAYRTGYGVLGAYLTARFAPKRPMMHALILGAIGCAVGIVGLVVTWNKMPEIGPRWYPIGLVVLGWVQAWVGGKLRVMQLSGAVND
jgi:hypothetical protein